MSELTQSEADMLIALEKSNTTVPAIKFPQAGTKIQIELSDNDATEKFYLNIWRCGIDLTKSNQHFRVRTSIPLLRIDLGDSLVHRNPDGEIVRGSHVHIYQEGYLIKWAYEIPYNQFNEKSDIQKSFEELTSYCNITQLPQIQWDLF